MANHTTSIVADNGKLEILCMRCKMRPVDTTKFPDAKICSICLIKALDTLMEELDSMEERGLLEEDD